MVGDGQVPAYRVLEIVELLVVRNVVDAVGGEVAADVGRPRAFSAAAEGVLETVHDFVVAE